MQMRKFILFCTFIFVSQFSNAVIESEKIYGFNRSLWKYY